MAAGVTTAGRSRPRFWVAYLVLGIALAAAGVLIGYELQSPGAAPAGQAWSSWQPSIPGVAGVLDIADHVGSQYQLANGHQLSRIKAGYPGASGTFDPSSPAQIRIPVTTIAVASIDPTGQTSYSLLPGYPGTIEYQLCGAGPRCQISRADGGPTQVVTNALHREVLELSLYTFHFVPEITQVLALVPPATPTGRPQAILIEDAGPVAARLGVPLDRTLPPGPTSPHTQQVIDGFTAPTFNYSYQQQFDGTYQMVLSLPQ